MLVRPAAIRCSSSASSLVVIFAATTDLPHRRGGRVDDDFAKRWSFVLTRSGGTWASFVIRDRGFDGRTMTRHQVGFRADLELPLLMVMGRTGVVPPFIGLDAPPLMPSHDGHRPAEPCSRARCVGGGAAYYSKGYYPVVFPGGAPLHIIKAASLRIASPSPPRPIIIRPVATRRQLISFGISQQQHRGF